MSEFLLLFESLLVHLHSAPKNHCEFLVSILQAVIQVKVFRIAQYSKLPRITLIIIILLLLRSFCVAYYYYCYNIMHVIL